MGGRTPFEIQIPHLPPSPPAVSQLLGLHVPMKLPTPSAFMWLPVISSSESGVRLREFYIGCKDASNVVRVIKSDNEVGNETSIVKDDHPSWHALTTGMQHFVSS